MTSTPLASHQALIDAVTNHPLFAVAGPGMTVLSMLSDAQELLGPAHPAHHLIDQAKILMIHFRLGIPAEQETPA